MPSTFQPSLFIYVPLAVIQMARMLMNDHILVNDLTTVGAVHGTSLLLLNIVLLLLFYACGCLACSACALSLCCSAPEFGSVYAL